MNQTNPPDITHDDPKLPTSILIVDGTNIENRCREAFHREDIDFRLFFAKVTHGTRLLHTHYFTAPYGGHDRERQAAQSGRFNALNAMPNTTLHLGRHQQRQVKCRNCGHTHTSYAEKGTDVAAAIELVGSVNQADRLILLAGDNDYRPALELTKRQGAHVTVGSVVSPSRGTQKQLMAVADLRHNCSNYMRLDDAFFADCWRPPKPPKRIKW